MGLAHANGQALVHGRAERNLVEHAAVHTGIDSVPPRGTSAARHAATVTLAIKTGHPESGAAAAPGARRLGHDHGNDPAAAARATNEMLGLVPRLRAERLADISLSW